MAVCKLCQAEYELHPDRCIVCRPCHDRVRSLPSQALKIEERLWGKCYEKSGCWEFNTPGADGRMGKLMMDKRQRPAAQVALTLAGRGRPSERHMARAECGNRMCARPDHLEWAQWIGGTGPAWAHGLSQADAVSLLDAGRVARAAYQRTYRRRLKDLGARSVGEFAERGRAAAARPVDDAPAVTPGASAVPAPSLLAALQGAKIAPVD